VAKRKRVLILEVPAGTDEQRVRDSTNWLTAKLAEAGYPDAVVLPVEWGMKLHELFAPRGQAEGPKVDREQFLALSQEMYDAISK